MIIIKRTDDLIMAIHEDILCIFNIHALAEYKPERQGSWCVGRLVNDQLMTEHIMATSTYHDMITEATECDIITKERLARLEDTDAKMNALEAGGVGNWEWYGESLKEYWAEREEHDLTCAECSKKYEHIGVVPAILMCSACIKKTEAKDESV